MKTNAGVPWFPVAVRGTVKREYRGATKGGTPPHKNAHVREGGAEEEVAGPVRAASASPIKLADLGGRTRGGGPSST